MIYEYLTVCCDKCVAALSETTPEAVDRLAFRKEPGSESPDLFPNHTVMHRVICEAGWYDDSLQTLCPEHYAELLASFQDQ